MLRVKVMNTIIIRAVVLLWGLRVLITSLAMCVNSWAFHMLSLHIVDFCLEMMFLGEKGISFWLRALSF